MDRGYASCEVFQLLLCLKLWYALARCSSFAAILTRSRCCEETTKVVRSRVFMGSTLKSHTNTTARSHGRGARRSSTTWVLLPFSRIVYVDL